MKQGMSCIEINYISRVIGNSFDIFPRYFPEFDPKDYFINQAESKNLTVKVIPLEKQHPVYSVEDIEVWEIRRV